MNVYMRGKCWSGVCRVVQMGEHAISLETASCVGFKPQI